MGILFAFLAALFASMSNFCMRRSIDAGGNSKAYLLVQLTFSFLVMIILNPVRSGDYTWGSHAVFLGLLGGIIFGLLMWGVGKSLEKGPAGLTFAVLNTSSVMPAVIMASLFGIAFGQSYSWNNAIGSFLVVIGLFWAAGASKRQANRAIWIIFAFLIFILHTLFLVYLQWWALLIKPGLPSSPFLPFHVDVVHTAWFMPAILFVGAFMQWLFYLKDGFRSPKRWEIYYGIFGGTANGVCTFFLILAPQVAINWQNAMIFPIFAVSIIVICNAWAQILYKEKVNWLANIVCLAGLVIGTLSWS